MMRAKDPDPRMVCAKLFDKKTQQITVTALAMTMTTTMTRTITIISISATLDVLNVG